jgi:hypothetical protein
MVCFVYEQKHKIFLKVLFGRYTWFNNQEREEMAGKIWPPSSYEEPSSATPVRWLPAINGQCTACSVSADFWLGETKSLQDSKNLRFLDRVWNVMAHAQKPDFIFQRKGRVHLNRRGHQFSRLMAAEVCASAVVMLDTTCSEVVWRVLATQSISQFPRHFPSRAPPCAITFQLDS